MSRIQLLLDVVEDMRSLADSLQAVAEAMAGNAQSGFPEAVPAAEKVERLPPS